ncbi:MAG: hypothetical protein M1374_03310 [Firmicutes bacterium]|nr:hypothetical protein [Bacillota bacterium]
MGLMDKVKMQAGQLADKAQEAGKLGQAKIEALQAKKNVKQTLAEIGIVTYLAHDGRDVTGNQDNLEALFNAVKEYENNYGAVSVADFQKDSNQ